MSFINQRRWADPPGHKAKRQAMAGLAFEMALCKGLETHENHTTSLARWAAYAARRRLHRKLQGGRWPAEVVS